MSARILLTLATIGLLTIPGRGFAQATGTAVTFTMPVNVTKLSRDITTVRVSCAISSAAIVGMNKTRAGSVDVPVSGGQAVATATVVVAPDLLDNAAGVAATYECSLLGFSGSLQNYDSFSETQALPAFRVTPTPVAVKGSFVW
ncbi:MAG: hypothetical protein AABZ01_13910 [Gemmatimonadota bacterium]|mgnify:FL=1